MRRAYLLGLVGLTLAACGTTTDNGGGVATNPGSQAVVPATNTPAPSGPAAQVGTTRTVLSPLGLNIRNGAGPTDTAVGSAGWGTTLTVTGYSAANGGWYQVQSPSTNGWVTADPTLTAPGSLSQYSSSDRLFSALYPSDWTFSENPTDVVFEPEGSGSQTISVAVSPPGTPIPAGGGSDYTESSTTTVIICGVTGELDTYTEISGTSPTAAAGAVTPLASLAQVQLQLDKTHTMSISAYYNSPAELALFDSFYNGLTFPFPECLGS